MMKLLNKNTFAALSMLLTIGAFTSCDESKTVVYEPAPPASGERVVYFGEEAETSLELVEGEDVFIFPVYRTFVDGDLTVPVTVTPAENYEGENPYEFPSEVVFDDGEYETYYVVTYDYDKAVKGQKRVYDIKLDTQYTTPYKLDFIQLALTKPAWTMLGKAYFEDKIMAQNFGLQPGEFELSQDDNNPKIFRIANPYYGINGSNTNYFVIQLLESGKDFEFDFFGDIYPLAVNGEDLVGFQMCYVVSEQGLDFYTMMPSMLSSTDAYNYVVDYQPNGLPNEIHLSPIYYNPSDGYWFGDTSMSEAITIIFPGGASLDTAINFDVQNAQWNADQTAITLDITEFGSDLTEAKIAIGKGRDTNLIASQIEAETLAAVTVTGKGSVTVPFGFTESGTYSIVAVGYIDGKPTKSMAAASFNYTATDEDQPGGGGTGNQGWKSLGYVDYTDGYMCANPIYFLAPTTEETIQTYPVEIQESQSLPGYYRLVNPYGEAYPYNEPGDYDSMTDSYLNIDATNPERVYVDYSEQTLYWGGQFNYGLAITWSLAGFFMSDMAEPQDRLTADEAAAQGLFGSYKDGKITFPATTLAAYWIFNDYPDMEGLYPANVVLDYQTYQAGGGGDANPYLLNPDGSYYAPFCVDMNTLTQDPTRTRSANSYKSDLKVSSTKAKPIGMMPKSTGIELTNMKSNKISVEIAPRLRNVIK